MIDRVPQHLVDAVRPPPTPPTPAYLAMMVALDDLDRAGGDGALGPDGRLYAGHDVLDHPAAAYLEAILRGWIDPQFGRRLVLSNAGRHAVLRTRRAREMEPDSDAGPSP